MPGDRGEATVESREAVRRGGGSASLRVSVPWPCQAGTWCPPPLASPLNPGAVARGAVVGDCCKSASITVRDGGACVGFVSLPLTLLLLTATTHPGGG